MKSAWIRKNGEKNLVVFFGGFACDENFFSNLNLPASCDVVMLFDYRDFNLDLNVDSYEDIAVVAWSFGVWVANALIDKFPSVCRRIAVNGSPFPVDDSLGIPREIFRKTSETFDDKNRDKFFGRVCGGFKGFASNGKMLCSRGSDELADELKSFAMAFKNKSVSDSKWTYAFASVDDKIFPLKNLRAAFGDSLRVVEGPHLNPLLIERAMSLASSCMSSDIVSPKIEEKIKKSFERNFDTYNSNGFIQRSISETLADSLFEFARDRLNPHPKNVLEIGCGTGFLTGQISKCFPDSKWILNDLSPKMCAAASSLCSAECESRAGDFMDANISGLFDLIISSSCFQWITDKTQLFKKLHSLSSDRSITAFSAFGRKNYSQICSITGRGLKYDTLETLCDVLSDSGFSVLYAAEDKIDVPFKTPFEVLKHIRTTGVNGGFSSFWTPSKAKSFASEYIKNFSNGDGMVELTYNPLYFICEKKHEK